MRSARCCGAAASDSSRCSWQNASARSSGLEQPRHRRGRGAGHVVDQVVRRTPLADRLVEPLDPRGSRRARGRSGGRARSCRARPGSPRRAPVRAAAAPGAARGTSGGIGEQQRPDPAQLDGRRCGPGRMRRLRSSRPSSTLSRPGGGSPSRCGSPGRLEPHHLAVGARPPRPRPAEYSAMMPSPRPNVVSRWSESAMSRLTAGGTGERSSTSTRGCRRVPRTRTWMGGLGVQDGVGHQLGDTELGGVHQLVAPETVHRVDDPQPGVLDRLRLGRQGERGAR